ncbi:hypothetical protein F4779DRAFT_640366 [Xylariaceae sp. FL0662B]|nr:hypothetical protein F4779DRAFT_640366 [Xylariaceae sp. FL0662B]
MIPFLPPGPAASSGLRRSGILRTIITGPRLAPTSPHTRKQRERRGTCSKEPRISLILVIRPSRALLSRPCKKGICSLPVSKRLPSQRVSPRVSKRKRSFVTPARVRAAEDGQPRPFFRNVVTRTAGGVHAGAEVSADAAFVLTYWGMMLWAGVGTIVVGQSVPPLLRKLL